MRRLLARAKAATFAVLIFVLQAIVLEGCADRAVVASREPLPAAMLTCQELPDLRRVQDDAGVAHGIAELSATARACRAHLAATRATLDAER